jgi:glycosyltransferase involved in cell wall biosynthesis
MSVGVVAPLVAPLAERQPYGNHIFLCDLARGLAGRGHEVTVYAAEGSRLPGQRIEAIPVDPRITGRFLLLRDNDSGEAQAMAQAFARLFDAVRRHGHDAVSQHAFDREAIDAACGLPVLHTLHLPPLQQAVVAAVARCEDPFCTVSSACAELWRRAAGRAVAIMPNGVPDGPASACGDVRPVAIMAGRIAREKGIACAIRCARRAGLAPWVIGEIYDERYFAEQVRPLLGDAHPIPVRFVPTMARDALRDLMGHAAVTLMPVEWDEPFGLVAAEAQLAGCPVVGYRRGALPEVIEHGVTGYLADAADEEALVAGIHLARRLDRSRIHRRALQRFGMAACLDRYERALSAL